jgi:hypothetical protein
MKHPNLTNDLPKRALALAVSVLVAAGPAWAVDPFRIQEPNAPGGNRTYENAVRDQRIDAAREPSVSPTRPATQAEASTLIGDGSTNGLSISVDRTTGETSFRGTVTALTPATREKILDSTVGQRADGSNITLRQQGAADVAAGRNTPAARLFTALSNPQAGTSVSFNYTAGSAGGAGRVATVGNGANAWETRTDSRGRTAEFAVPPPGAPGAPVAGPAANENGAPVATGGRPPTKTAPRWPRGPAPLRRKSSGLSMARPIAGGRPPRARRPNSSETGRPMVWTSG